MKRLLVFGLLLAAVPVHAAIAQKQTFSCYTATASQLNCPMTAVALDAGDFVVVIGAPGGTNYDLAAANCGGLVLARVSVTQGARTADVWAGGPVSSSAPSCVITPARASGNDSVNAWVGTTYSGVSGVNALAGQSVPSPPPASPYMCPPGVATAGISPVAAGNTLIGYFRNSGVVAVGWTASFVGLGMGSGTTSTAIVQPFVPSTPVVNVSNLGANGAVLYAFQAPVTSGMVGLRATPYATATYSAPSGSMPACSWGVIELKAAPSTGTVTTQSAKLSDATQTVLLQNATGVNYVLPNQLLASNWCTWVMPTVTTGLNTLSPQSPNLVNGQAAAINLKPWQMSRVCQDSTGNYWTNPPLVQGTGITIDNQPTGITISTTGTRAALPALAHGRVEVGGHPIPAGKCSLPVEAHAERVAASDIVEHSTPNLESPYLEIWAFSRDDKVEFEVCNSSSHSITPRRTSLTWRVSR